VNRSLRACALSRLARSNCVEHRLSRHKELGAYSALICKNDRKRRGQRTCLSNKTDVVSETLH
jgi:ribosomal protein S13